ncbi:MAG: DNA polymerase III subunit alpha [Candidatus Dormibacteria bacterium]
MGSAFTELAARSHYSFLEGSASPRQLVEAARSCGISALGISDRNGLYGAVAFIQAAQSAGIHPVIGAELDLRGGSRLRFVARDRGGYRQLSRAISSAQLAGEKGQPLLDLGFDPEVVTLPGASPGPARVAAGAGQNASPRRRVETLPPPERPAAWRPTAGPFPGGWPGLPSQQPLATGAPARVDPVDLSGCTVLVGGAHSPVTAALLAGDRRTAARRADALREAFGRDRVALLLSHHLHPADRWLAGETAALAAECGLPLVASGTPVHATVEDKPLLDVLTAIRHRTTLDQASAHGLLLPNTEHRLRSEFELRALLAEHPQAFDHAAHLAAGCRVALDFSDVRFPGFPVPRGETPFSVLYRLCQEAVQRRYQPMTREVAARLQRELDVIEKTGLAEFFLITWDIMRFAREQGIPGQGRGSAADSIVAYLLGVTRVDPVEHDLLFERFLHEDHQGTPDIDIDFSTDHRERVIQYIYEKYGAERTGMVANVITFRPRMAVRQVGAALGFPETIIDPLAKSVDDYYWGGFGRALETSGLVDSSKSAALPWRQFTALLEQIIGTPRHLGIHVGGMLVTGEPLVDIAPVERASMAGRVVVQFNKDDVEDLGLIKMDLLGLRTLSVVAECLELAERTTGVRPDLDALPLDDPAVYDTICHPDTIGMFQIESRAQQQSLYQSQPRVFNDLIIQVAIIRPGPIQGEAVHPFLRRRRGLEPVTYMHPSLEPILAETRGVILYQEQILRIVMEVAGYTAGEADRFRRAMNRHRSHLEMESLREEFLRRCREHAGIGEEVAEKIFKAAGGFAQFGFCKSHAAAFARTAYETAWLRLHHGAAYLCSLLNAQPMGFYHPSVLVEDGKRHGIRTLPVDVSRSRARCTLEWVGTAAPPAGAVRAGMAPGWRLAPQGTGTGADDVVPDAGCGPATAGDAAAERSVEIACRAVGGERGRPQQGRPRSPRLGGAESPWAVRLGFNYVAGLGPEGRAVCEQAVAAGATGSVRDFWRHTQLTRPAMENLVMGGAFDRIAAGRSRRELLWELPETEEGISRRRTRRTQQDPAPPATTLPMSVGGAPSAAPPRGRGATSSAHPARDPGRDDLPPLLDLPAQPPQLPGLNERQRTATEYRLSGLSTGPHLLSFIRAQLDALRCVPLAAVPDHADGERIRVAGLVIARQAPVSAKGFRFFTLADEGGHLDLVFRPQVLDRTRAVANFHPLLVVDGLLEVQDGRCNILVTEVQAVDGEGRLIPTARARLGRGSAAAAPRPQHHNILPPAHDYH